MDRSILSQKSVIDASREFICVRLATYESAEEAEFLKTVYLGRTGELENTVFTILAPDGKEKLVRGHRSPQFVFRGNSMARSMQEIAQRYKAKSTVGEGALKLPKLADVRLAMNVAACDSQMLVVAIGDKKTLPQRRKELAEQAWSKDFIGHFAYAETSDRKELAKIDGLRPDAAFVVIEPNTYGSEGKALTQASSVEQLQGAMALALSVHEKAMKSHRQHVSSGKADGIHWKTAIPVTDPMSPSNPNRSGPGPRR